MSAVPITILGEEFVLLPKKEFERLQGAPANCVEAFPAMRKAIGEDLRMAREAADLTQVELAKRLRRSQAFVCGAETGVSRVGARYWKAVLKACNLPDDYDPRENPQSIR